VDGVKDLTPFQKKSLVMLGALLFGLAVSRPLTLLSAGGLMLLAGNRKFQKDEIKRSALVAGGGLVIGLGIREAFRG
jgi:uncharacterized membrane protein